VTPEDRAQLLCSEHGYNGRRDGDAYHVALFHILAAMAEEREACAKIAEDHLLWVHQDACYEEIAAKIRGRG
jgi:hypothetical protein